MSTSETSRWTGALWALAVGVTGCMADPGGDAAALGQGARGAQVRAVFDYLHTYGYFERQDFRERYPGWEPAVRQLPRDPEVFDATFATALRAFQRMAGLPQTGSIDDATRRLMAEPRCGHPDTDPTQVDPRRKFAHGPTRWNTPAITYFIESFTADLPVEVSKNTLRSAFLKWHERVPLLTFTRQLSPSSPRITIRMNGVIDGPSNTLANASFPHQGGEMNFDEAETWTVPGRGVVGTDLETIALHEIGHAIGLEHSSVRRSAMFPTAGSSSLSADDIRAANALYPRWDLVGGQGRDIAANGGQVWAIGNSPRAGGFNIMKLVNGAWQDVEGGAVRITVDIGGNPWVVNSNKVLFQRKDDRWHVVSTPAGVTDVAAAGDGKTWIIDDSPVPGGFRIWKYDFFTRSWQQIPGGAVRVGAGGSIFARDKVWLVNSLNQVFRLRDGWHWDHVVNAVAVDVAVGSDVLIGGNQDQSGVTDGTVAMIGADGFPYVWMEQRAETVEGKAPGVAEFRLVSYLRPPTGSLNVAIDETGRFWVTDNQLQIKRQY